MNKSKKRTLKTICFMTAFSIVVIALFFIIKTRTSPLNTDTISSMTEVEKLLSKDIPNSYPSSPREVLKLYSRFTKSLYNENLKEDQIESLSKQVSNLYDEELLANKTYEDYLVDLKVEISEYRKANRTIINYIVEENGAVVYWEKDKVEYASLVTSYTLKEESDYSKIYEKFILKKDDEDKWKILGWELSDKTEIDSGE